MMNWAKKLAELIEAVIRMVLALILAVLGDEWDGVKPAARRLGAAAKGAVPGVVADGLSAAGRGLGLALTLPLHAVDVTASAIGATLGAMLPRPPVTAKAVADGAVAQDDARTYRDTPEYQEAHAGLVAANLVGIRIQGAASSLLSRGGSLHSIYADGLTPPIATWLEGLTAAQLQAVVDAPSYALDRHVNATKREDLLPGLPRVLSSTARLARADAEVDVSPQAMAEMMRKAHANRLADRAGAADMAKRGPRPPEEPEGGRVIPIRGPRPTSRPSFG
ncbi:hypothetical protein [Methylorubrum extorquens]|uniref:Uncharacterized protein n=1 Tax=Methylorubrum extorquens TaxID=408 RepID=A0AAX3WMX7_METEX|nr:hypothetical protein [Methylorubrum extorquens]WHQ72050.1 hypothetical protein KEC54_11170 [Methylorubrum extorquens]